jgi:16S rRNA (adenine1518-N6/adenine1519-N6)-dimethyltransferase
MALQKSLGQHFLNNQKATNDIVAAVGVAQGDVIIEIGPGAGAITKPLAELCTKYGAEIFAIEKDTKLVIDIQHAVPNLAGHVEHGDALELLPALIQKINPKSYKIVGNIPYYITGHLLRIIGELDHKPSKTVLMIQKEVAERVSSRAPHMNLLAAATQYWGDVKTLFTLKPKDFTPPPEVSSAVIAIISKPKAESADHDSAFYSFIRAAFKQPRKTLLNNLTDGFPDTPRETITEIMSKNGLKPTSRAQDLDTESLIKLSHVFKKD